MLIWPTETIFGNSSGSSNRATKKPLLITALRIHEIRNINKKEFYFRTNRLGVDGIPVRFGGEALDSSLRRLIEGLDVQDAPQVVPSPIRGPVPGKLRPVQLVTWNYFRRHFKIVH
jgi:hypothetical protein